jgi:acyl-coenzyme A synthetase/AMP-(fatty) acid ligase
VTYQEIGWIEFVDDLPKTPTGKIQRFRLRAACSGLPAPDTPAIMRAP